MVCAKQSNQNHPLKMLARSTHLSVCRCCTWYTEWKPKSLHDLAPVASQTLPNSCFTLPHSTPAMSLPWCSLDEPDMLLPQDLCYGHFELLLEVLPVDNQEANFLNSFKSSPNVISSLRLTLTTLFKTAAPPLNSQHHLPCSNFFVYIEFLIVSQIIFLLYWFIVFLLH